MDETKNRINDLEHKEAKNNNEEKREEKRIQKNAYSINSFWDNFKRYDICIVGVQEEEKEQEIQNLPEKIRKETFPNLVKEIDMQVQEAQRVQTRWM